MRLMEWNGMLNCTCMHFIQVLLFLDQAFNSRGKRNYWAVGLVDDCYIHVQMCCCCTNVPSVHLDSVMTLGAGSTFLYDLRRPRGLISRR